MKQNKPILEEDIDLIGLFLMLWNNKWKLLFITFTVTLFGTVYLYIKDIMRVEKNPIYETHIKLIFENEPPFPLNRNQTILDYKKLFNSELIFTKWSETNSTEITLSNFSDTRLFEESIIKKNDEELFKFFKLKDGINYIFFRIPNFSYLDDIYDYAKYISNELRLNYIDLLVEAKKELNQKFIKYNSLNPNRPTSNYLIDQILIEQYLLELEKGNEVIDVHAPSKPINIYKSPPKELSLRKVLIFIFFGLFVGTFSVFIINAISVRKKIKEFL